MPYLRNRKIVKMIACPGGNKGQMAPSLPVLTSVTYGARRRVQALASAPNIIHSFDAAHLSMTVNAGAERGISAWAMIHDSFATHAGSSLF